MVEILRDRHLILDCFNRRVLELRTLKNQVLDRVLEVGVIHADTQWALLMVMQH